MNSEQRRIYFQPLMQQEKFMEFCPKLKTWLNTLKMSWSIITRLKQLKSYLFKEKVANFILFGAGLSRLGCKHGIGCRYLYPSQN